MKNSLDTGTLLLGSFLAIFYLQESSVKGKRYLNGFKWGTQFVTLVCTFDCLSHIVARDQRVHKKDK